MSGKHRPGLLPGASVFNFESIHLNPLEYEEGILVHGSSGEYRRGMLCPCARVETGQGAVGCKNCRGLGWVHPKKMREPMIFLDSSRSAQGANHGSGWLLDGQIQVSFPLGVIPARGDLLFPDSEVGVIHETLWRALQQLDGRTVRRDLDQPGQRPGTLGPRRERLLYDDIHTEDIQQISYRDGDGELVLAHRSEWRLRGADIEWQGSCGPKVGEGYSVRYCAPVAYMVMKQWPAFRREADAVMPWRANLSRIDKLQETDLI